MSIAARPVVLRFSRSLSRSARSFRVCSTGAASGSRRSPSEAAHQIEDLAFVGALLAAKPFQVLTSKVTVLVSGRAPLGRALLDEAPRLVGKIGDEADLVGIGVAHRRIELASRL